MSLINLSKNSFNGGEWARALWNRIDIKTFPSGCKTVQNIIPRIEGGGDNRGGLHMVYETKFSGSNLSRLEKFIFSTQQAYQIEFGNLYCRFYMNDGVILSGGVPVEIVTPYLDTDLALLKFEQSADVLYITHPSYPTATISRTSHTTWFYTVVSFSPGQAPPTGLTSTGGTNNMFVVTAVSATQIESIGTSPVNANYGSTLNWTAATGASFYNVYVNDNGNYYFIGRAGSNSYLIPNPPTENTALSPPQVTTLFNGANLYPGVSAFFGGRLIFARTNTQPQTLFGSVIGDFLNMNFSSPVQDNDAFQFTINSRQVNEIKWIVSLRACIIGTSGGEWLMQPGNTQTTITPTSVDLEPQSKYGCCDLAALVIGYSVLFVDRSTKLVRSLSYELQIDAYDGTELTVLSRHLFRTSGIIAWDYQQWPTTTVWCVRADGVLCGMTYFSEDKVNGWSRHVTDGLFESVSVIPLPTGDDEVWVIVNRTINGASRRFVERLDNREFTTIQNAFFVDCGVTYSGAPATTFTGLSYLEGKTVTILADGNVIDGLVVTSGTVTIPNAASTVTIGLPYTWQLETLDLTAQTQVGELLNLNRNIVSVSVELENTRELFIGPDVTHLVEVPFRTTENFGVATNLFTGEKPTIAVMPGGGRSSSIFMQGVDPVPASILAISAEIDYGER